jgi:DNA-binding LytR/AlgR family response regulator
MRWASAWSSRGAHSNARAGRLLISQTGRTLVVNVDEIDWIEAADYCVELTVKK